MYQIIPNAAPPVLHRAHIYPFHAMSVGDGFDVADDLGETSKGFSRRITSLRNGFIKYRKHANSNAKVIIGPSPAGEGLLRCVRVR